MGVNSWYVTRYLLSLSLQCPVAATSSGFRRNNPHPSREFMEWKIPRGGGREEQVLLDEDKLRDVFKKQLTTSYQVTLQIYTLYNLNNYKHLLRGQGRGPSRPDPQNWVMWFLDTRKQALPAGLYRIKNCVPSQINDPSKFGSRLYLQYVHKFQSRLLKMNFKIILLLGFSINAIKLVDNYFLIDPKNVCLQSFKQIRWKT